MVKFEYFAFTNISLASFVAPQMSAQLVYIHKILVRPVGEILEGVIVDYLLDGCSLLVRDHSPYGVHRVIHHFGVFSSSDTLFFVFLVEEKQISCVQSRSY